MRAVRFHGREDLRLDEIEEPECESGQVKVYTTGLCRDMRQWYEPKIPRLPLHSSHVLADLHEYLAGPMVVPVSPHPITGEKLPTTLGHEFSGTIEEIGRDVTDLKVGDRVAVKPNLYDGICPSCSMGRVNCCDSLGFIGYSSQTGGLSDHMVMDQKHAIPLPDSIPLDIGALVEPLSVAWHAVSRSSLQNNDTALVVGAGPIGLAIVLVLKSRGVRNIIVVEVSEKRRLFARTFGATEILNPSEVDVVAQLHALTRDARGVSMAFECSGVQAGLDTAISGTRVRGTTVIVSIWDKKPAIDALALVLYEKHVTGAVVYDDGDFEAVIEAIASGKIQPRPMITSKIAMEDVVEKGFRALIHEKDQHVKILVDVSA
ncbi:hypothetical protein NUU61_004290 [Penicillium alfredii]|uniref:Enoyl reductase (ER) domain-containing protein n=1 Tax=Penicillium alfredii TaxID=1506179 RepID=A0A9W9FKU9_9EURO|nr:uncharacterized protein NUU61_004290 [Penicillium alfredii]KAJ5102068.1 hypothetical protein NUU61_004290 [Penicillium alfredii]